jgi:uncharacterized protein HemX
MPELLESPKPNINPPRHDTREEMKAVAEEHKKAKSRRPWWITAIVLPILGAGGAGAGGMVMGDDAKEKAAASRQKLDDHIAVEREVRRETKEHLKRHDSALHKQGRTLDRVELLLELELDQHKVPQSKRPKREEGPEIEDPEGDP